MATYLIRHSPVLSGEVEVHAAKNAVLPLLAAGLLTEEPLVLKEVPRITDVETLLTILRDCGAQVTRSGSEVSVCALQPRSPLHEENMRLMDENTRLRNGMGGTQTVTETVKVPDPEVVKELEEARAEIARLRKEIESKADTSAQSAETAKALSDKDAQIKRLNEEVSKLRAAASTGIEPEALRELEKQIERFEVIRRKQDARINDLQHRQKELVASEKSLKEEIAALKSRLDGGDVTDLSVSESESFSSSRRRTVRHDAPIDDILSDTDWLVPSSSLKSSKNTDPEGSRRSRRERAKDQNKDQSKDNESGQMRLF